MSGGDDQALSAYSAHGFNPTGSNDSWSNLYLHIPAGTRVLDVGCSSGNFGEALERLKGCTVVGVDLDAADIAEAATKISRALVFDITSAPSLDELGTFDVIVFADVLEHLGDPRGALRRILSILRPGGFVVYSIPNMTHASVRFDLLRGQFAYTQTGILDKTHVHFYDRAEVDDVFASAGFEVVAENPVVFPYPDQMLADDLASLGLGVDTDDPTFFDALARTDGSVLQFVGKAAPVGAAGGADADGASSGADGGVPDAAGAALAAPGRAPHVREREFPPDEINRRVTELQARVVEAETVRNELQARADAAEVALAASNAEASAADARAAEAVADAAAERTRADGAQAELDRLSAVIAELKHNPLRFAARRLRRD